MQPQHLNKAIAAVNPNGSLLLRCVQHFKIITFLPTEHIICKQTFKWSNYLQANVQIFKKRISHPSNHHKNKHSNMQQTNFRMFKEKQTLKCATHTRLLLILFRLSAWCLIRPGSLTLPRSRVTLPAALAACRVKGPTSRGAGLYTNAVGFSTCSRHGVERAGESGAALDSACGESKVSAVTSHARRGGPMPKLVFWFFVCHCLYVCLFEYTLLTACRLIVWSFVVDSLNVWTFDSLIVWMFNYSKCAQLISWTLQHLIDQTGADKHSTQTFKKPNGFF